MIFIFAQLIETDTPEMKKITNSSTRKIASLIGLMSFTLTLFAQGGQGGGDSSNLVLLTLIALSIALIFAVVVLVSDNLIRIRARQIGVDTESTNLSVFPRSNEIFSPKRPSFVNGDYVTHLKKGYDIQLEGAVISESVEDLPVTRFAIQPPNFRGISPIPKLDAEVGAEVKAGDVLFHDKNRPDVKYVAPVSGELVALNRGAKRAINELVILADKEQKYRELPSIDLENASREELVDFVKGSGAWPLILQRPYNIVPNPDIIPRDIFISTFNTAPLSLDLNKAVEGREEDFQIGLNLLAKMTSGKVHIGLNAGGESAPHPAFTEAKNVKKYWFSGPHPAGNVGVQMHYIAPITGGNDVVWTVKVQDVITLGALITKRRFDTSRIVSLVGAELKTPVHVRTYLGANIGDLLKNNIQGDHVRIISGDVLTGMKKEEEGFLNAHDEMVTVVSEGDYYDMFGWLLPSSMRPTVSRSFPNFLFPDLEYRAETNTHGERRAFVVTGQYEKVLPMDIYLQHLSKSILFNDFERMEKLGIYELVEEDIALCEFACTSKQPLQELLREGLETMRAQG